jgi:hypothetical protein
VRKGLFHRDNRPAFFLLLDSPFQKGKSIIEKFLFRPELADILEFIQHRELCRTQIDL